jgi:hypothetical protein
MKTRKWLAFGFGWLVACILLPAAAAPIAITLDTSALAGADVALAFDLTESTENTVTIDPFVSDITTFGDIVVTGNVSGTLPAAVTLGGAPSSFFNEYLQTVTLGNSITFSFVATTTPVAPGSDPDLFTLFLLDPQTLLPLIDETTGLPFGDEATGALLSYAFGVEAPSLTLFSSGRLPIAMAGPNPASEPAGLALVAAALLAIAVVGKRRFQ